ncbi:serine/threonine-protein kinase [Propioniciclava sp.]|uniref:serine/threonine-protein kinase n=1 Tax=Propioniciclava sp. TaxID=2038686 RepID=UPI0026238AF5|nr:serine/threonine-protein kinase [Propioniciclava sp.]
MTHPNVVTIHDLGTTENTAYMVMERLPGPNLQRLVAQRGALPIPEVVAYGEQTARGLAAAHARGILHRDIKPSNLMLAADTTIKVVDFGIAAFLGEAGLTATTDYVGTPAYTAPERAAYAPATEASDLYALGCVLFFLAAERPPFEPPDALHQHLTSQPPPLAQLRPEAPEGLVALVAQLLAKDPADRPGSASEVADRLRGLAAPETTPGRAPSVDPPTRPRTPRPAPAASAPLPPTADPTTATRMRRLPDDAAGPARARRPAPFLAIAAVLAVLFAAIPVAWWAASRLTPAGGVTPGPTPEAAGASPTPTTRPANGGVTQAAQPTYRLTTGGTSTFRLPMLGTYEATVTDVRTEGYDVQVKFETRGESDMRRPEDTCLLARSSDGTEYEMQAVATALTTDEATHRVGTWQFVVPVGGTYALRYDGAEDYSDAPLGSGEVPALGLARAEADQFATVTGILQFTVEMIVVAASVPDAACLAADTSRSASVTAERIGQTGRTWRARATFAEDPSGQQLTLGCGANWPALPLP